MRTYTTIEALYETNVISGQFVLVDTVTHRNFYFYKNKLTILEYSQANSLFKTKEKGYGNFSKIQNRYEVWYDEICLYE